MDSSTLLQADTEMSVFAKTIYESKYAWKNDDGEVVERWPDTARRVAVNVMGALGYGPESHETQRIQRLITERKFMPGGRYLYASGRGLHQTQNCLLLRAEDSREGWAELMRQAGMALMTGAGIGIDYSDVRPSGRVIAKTGGTASGPISLMKIINEIGRNVMQGGARRSAIWAGLSWQHEDVFEFIKVKDWSDEVRALKEKDFTFPATLDMTNVSVILDDLFFEAFKNSEHQLHQRAQEVYWKTTTRMVKTAEPGFSVDTGVNAGETLRNAPVTANTNVLTDRGYLSVGEVVGTPINVWTGMKWANDVVFKETNSSAPILAVQMTGGRVVRCEPNHEFLVERYQGRGAKRKLICIDRIKARDLQLGDQLHVSMPATHTVPIFKSESYTLGFIYGDGSFTKAGGAELTLCTPASKACLPSLTGYRHLTESDSRGYTRLYFSVDTHWTGRSKSLFPQELFSQNIDVITSFIAGLFDADGNWEPSQRRIRLASKHQEFLVGVRRLLEQLGIMSHVSKAGTSTYGKSQGYQLVVAAESMSMFVGLVPTQRIIPDLMGYQAYRPQSIKVLSVKSDGFEAVFCADVREPEHSFMAEGVIISNCTEVCSRDDSDICNLGSVNLARINSLEEFKEVVELGTLFLLAGTVYSDVPYSKVDEVRQKNRRLGLGLMGVHEFQLVRGKSYEPDEELAEYLEIYATSTEIAAYYADMHGLSRPVKTRAIAPTGTIGIIAETTTGIEPIFCVAFIRRYRLASADGNDVIKFQYVIDPTARRLIDNGANWRDIEDAYKLAYVVERRVAFQAWMQKYVDHGISSTVNLPEPITDPQDIRDFGNMLMKYLPDLRGITCYPNGARGGQPIVPVLYSEAIGQEGLVFEETEERCVAGACGT